MQRKMSKKLRMKRLMKANKRINLKMAKASVGFMHAKNVAMIKWL